MRREVTRRECWAAGCKAAGTWGEQRQVGVRLGFRATPQLPLRQPRAPWALSQQSPSGLEGAKRIPPVTEGPSPRTPLGPGVPSPTSPVLALTPQKVGAPEECSPGFRGLFGLWEALWGCGWGPASGSQAPLVAGLS